ncbi:MAG: methyltransferase domain-containing protein, partial [Alphaproteobacteria bacterium]
MSNRKYEIRRLHDELAQQRAYWLAKGAFFHAEDLRYLKFLIPEGRRILELGCGTGHLIADLKPSFGVGVDFSEAMIAQARKAHPDLTFLVGDIEDETFVHSLGGPFDVILIVDTIGSLDDCQRTLEILHPLCTRETRLVIAYFSHLWYPILKFAEAVGLRMPHPAQNVLAPPEVRALARLAGFEAVKTEQRVLVPMRLFGLGRVMNRFVAPLPLINALSLRHYVVCRSLQHVDDD